MSVIFTYRDNEIYSHHTVDVIPDADSFSMHAHEWMEIFYIISGNGNYLVEGNQYQLKPNDIFIMRSSEAHRLLIDSSQAYERIAIHFSPALIAKVDPNLWLLRPFVDRQLGQMNRFAGDDARFENMRKAFADYNFDNISDIHLNIMGRLLMFLTSLNGVYESTSMHHTPEQGIQSQLVSYVNEHMFEHISLQSVSEHFYLSQSQIRRLFQRATGSPLWEYVKIKRLLAARAMIQRGENANTACHTCGFSDYSAFFRAYPSYFGHSPREDAPEN